MPIHFTCSKCGKKMFAQDQFAGQHVNCPECRTGNVIPHTSQPVEMTPSEPGGEFSTARLNPKPRPPTEPDAIWRSIARFSVMATTSWMIFLMVMMLGQEDIAGFAVVFDIVLIAGLTFSRMQMRNGPFTVFLAAGLTVALSMPLLSQLGFVYRITPELLTEINKHVQPGQPALTLEAANANVNANVWVVCSFIGLLASFPIWIAGMKVAAAQRLRDARRK